MSAIQINRRLKSGPGRRTVELFQDRPAHGDLKSTQALVRNHFTLIYPGFDLARLARSEEQDEWLDLGCLAIGRIQEPDAFGRVNEGDWVYWNGPHADFGILDLDSDIWAALEGPDPMLLPAGIGAEAAMGCISTILNDGDAPLTHSLVIGQGMLGHLAAQWLKHLGSSVTVIENSPKRLEFSKYLGLIQRVDTHNLDWHRKIEKWNPSGAGLLVDACGYERPVLDVLPHLNHGGNVLLLGSWRPGLDPASLPAEAAEAFRLQAARLHGPPPPFGQTEGQRPLLEEWLKLIGDGQIPVDRLITNHAAPEDAPMDMKRLAAGVKSMCGVVIHWVE